MFSLVRSFAAMPTTIVQELEKQLDAGKGLLHSSSVEEKMALWSSAADVS